MEDSPLTLHGYPRAILHIDGDAFFASCEQARNPKLKGKAVVTGKERGIASSMSYEAKSRGVTRGMPLYEIKKVCPEAIILPSDYETYSLLSKRFFAIVRRFTPDVEEYSIDECFADITGLRRPLRMSYEKITTAIKDSLEKELGFTFSFGLAPNKVLAKVGSKWKKPSGATFIPGYRAHFYLEKLALDKIWGIGAQTKAYLEKCGLNSALDLARKDEQWIKANLTKPHIETWRELRGEYVLMLDTAEKQTYSSIQKVKTFTPPSDKKEFVFAQLSKNIENACIKLRRYNLAAKEAVFFLKQQNFSHRAIRLQFPLPTCIPSDIISAAEEHFDKLFKPRTLYRSTGVVLFSLEHSEIRQYDLFGHAEKKNESIKLYKVLDCINEKYGKHKVHLAISMRAHTRSQHKTDRNDSPERTTELFLGETKRKKLGIPMFTGEIF